MITKVSHALIWVTNYEKALDFYANKLGFEVRADFKMDSGFRWLTVGPKSQPDIEFILGEPRMEGNLSADNSRKIREILEDGGMSGGVFDTDDCQKTYEALKAKGVEFVSAPKDEPYGIEAIMKDGCGNWMSLRQPKPMPANWQG